MICHVTLKREAHGVSARCDEFPECEGRGTTKEDALGKLRASVLFWLEACPCDQHAEAAIDLQVVRDEKS